MHTDSAHSSPPGKSLASFPARLHPVTAAWCVVLSGLVTGILLDHFASFIYSLPFQLFPLITIIPSPFPKPFHPTSKTRWLLVCLLLGLNGGALRHHIGQHTILPGDLRGFLHPEHPRLVSVSGILIDLQKQATANPEDSPTSRAIIQVRQIQGKNTTHTASGKLLLEIASDKLNAICPGTPVAVTGWLEPLHDALNPGEWSPASFWNDQGVVAYMDARHRGLIEIDTTQKPIFWRIWRDRCRTACRNAIAFHLPAAQAPLVEALVLGIRENVPDHDRNLFRDTGTLHLLAISGLHLQVVAMFVMWLAGRVGLGQKKAAWAVITTSAAYALLVTGGASVTRATLMASAIALAALRARPGAFWHRMALSASIVLYIKPTDLFDAGAQLSFLGTAAIYEASILWQILASKWLMRSDRTPFEFIFTSSSGFFFFEDRTDATPSSLQRWARRLFFILILLKISLLKLAEAIFISAVVWFVTAILVAFHFESLNFIAILVNLPLVPATSLALMLGLAGMILSLSGLGFFGFYFLSASGWIMSKCLDVLDFALRFGGPPVAWSTIETWAVTGFYLLLSIAYFSRHFNCSSRTRQAVIVFPIVWLFITSTTTHFFLNRPPNYLEAEMLAVDHGLAILIRWPDGQNWLYDCGQMGRPAVGRRIIAPALKERGVHKINQLFISHADTDHFNGVLSMMEAGIAVDSLVSTANFFQSNNPDALGLKQSLAQAGIPFKQVAAGTVLRNDNSGTARILYPFAGTRPGRADNATSLVLELNYNNISMLITGDLEGEGLDEFRIQASGRFFDIVTAPHHGGLTSNPGWFYEQFSPALVISSQGRNRFGLANGLKSHIAKFCPQGHLRITATDGAIRLRWSADGVAISSFRRISPELQLQSAGRQTLLEGRDPRPAQRVLNP